MNVMDSELYYIEKEILEIFVEASRIPTNYNRPMNNCEGDIAIGPSYFPVVVYKSLNPKDNY
jgi:hypothetical protein